MNKNKFNSLDLRAGSRTAPADISGPNNYQK